MDYARQHGFTLVNARTVSCCPDCSARARPRIWGQYIYYSTLLRLRECERCGLIWADARIDPDLVRRHFESTYKDADYFRIARKAIFEHLSLTIARLAPRGARVLDIGGARGDLMATLVARRPDVDATVHDLSSIATASAAARFGFATLTGDVSALDLHRQRYEVVVLSDVLYYEPNLTQLWQVLPGLLQPGGSLVLRLPNKVPLIRLGRLWTEVACGRRRRLLQDRVPFYNPEHIFLFRRRYLRRRLKDIGFARVRFMPSPPLATRHPLALAPFLLGKLISRTGFGLLTVTPSMLVTATLDRGPAANA